MRICSHSPVSCIGLQKSSVSKITFKLNGCNCTEIVQYFLKTTYQLSSIHIIKMAEAHTDFSSKTVTVFFPQRHWKRMYFRSIASNIVHYVTVTFKLTHKNEVQTQMVKHTLRRGEKNLVKKCFLPLTFMN